MAENDQNNDEYKFVELDNLDNDMMGDGEPDLEKSASTFPHSDSSHSNIKKNALIAIGVVVGLMVLYKLVGYMFSSKTDTVAATHQVIPIVQETPPVQTVVTPVPEQTAVQPQPIETQNNSELSQKVSSIEVTQQSVRSEVGTVSQQVGVVNNNINNLNNQIASLNQTINALATQLAKQSEEINMLMVRTQPKRVVKHIIKTTIPRINYYIQAVIPGRAWIIGTNGSTLTVREGTKIAGYGIVRLIDPLEGRVVTSSGQVIRFSQEDS